MNYSQARSPRDPYQPLHIFTFVLIISSALMVSWEVPASSSLIFMVGITASFFLSWRERTPWAFFDLIEYLFWACFMLLILIYFSKTSFVWEEVVRLAINTLLVLEVFMGFHLVKQRRYSILQAMSLMAFLISTLPFIKKDEPYFVFLFIYMVAWFFILRYTYIRQINNQAGQIAYNTAKPKESAGWGYIAWFFVVVLLSTLLLSSGIRRFKPYTFGILPSELAGLGMEGESSQSEVFFDSPHTEGINFQRFNDLTKKINALDAMSIQDKSSSIWLLSRLINANMPVQEVLHSLLGLIDLLKKPGPGLERQRDRQIVQTLQAVNDYAVSRIALKQEQLNKKILEQLNQSGTASTLKGEIMPMTSRMMHAKNIDEVNTLLQAVKAQELTKTHQGIAADFKELGLAQMAQLHSKVNEGLEGIAGVAHDYAYLKKSTLQAEQFQEIFTAHNNIVEAIKESELSKEKQEQILRVEQAILGADSPESVNEAAEFFNLYTEKLYDLGMLSKGGCGLLQASIRELTDTKKEILHDIEEAEAEDTVPGDLMQTITSKDEPEDVNREAEEPPKEKPEEIDQEDKEPPKEKPQEKDNEDAQTKVQDQEDKDEPEQTQKTQRSKTVRILSIKVIPQEQTIALGQKAVFTAEAIYRGLLKRDVSILCDWESSNPAVAASVACGTFASLAKGNSYITASFAGAKSKKAVVKVTPPRLVSIVISPSAPVIALHKSMALTAKGKYTDSRIMDMASRVNWHVGDSSICSVNDAGEVTALRLGKTTICAQYGDVESSEEMVMVVPFIVDTVMLIKLIVGVIALILIALILLFHLLNREHIKKLDMLRERDPRSYCLKLYQYLGSLLAVYGVRRNRYTTPKVFVQEVQAILDDELLNKALSGLTEGFEKARYSNGNIELGFPLKMKDNYNQIIARMSFGNGLLRNILVRLYASVMVIPFS